MADVLCDIFLPKEMLEKGIEKGIKKLKKMQKSIKQREEVLAKQKAAFKSQTNEFKRLKDFESKYRVVFMEHEDLEDRVGRALDILNDEEEEYDD